MGAGQLIREGRRRAGLTQAALAERLGTSQSVIARWETGAVSPSFETLRRVLRACGFELDVALVSHEEGFDHDWSLALQNLRLSPEERLDQIEELAAFVRDGRAAMDRATPAGG